MGSFNKISGRYSEMKDEFYVANPVRKQSTTNKQGSGEENIAEILFDDPIAGEVLLDPSDFIASSHRQSYERYEALLAAGTAKEVARGVLPADLYTEFYWTVNLRSLFNFLQLRLDSHAQKEIRDFAEAIMSLLKEHVDIPFALEAFQDYVLDDPQLSKFELEIIRQLIRDGVSEDDRSQLAGHAQELINGHPTMSKREKTETKLIKLLELDEQ
jgi:thymidylate synthase (FAD)